MWVLVWNFHQCRGVTHAVTHAHTTLSTASTSPRAFSPSSLDANTDVLFPSQQRWVMTKTRHQLSGFLTIFLNFWMWRRNFWWCVFVFFPVQKGAFVGKSNNGAAGARLWASESKPKHKCVSKQSCWGDWEPTGCVCSSCCYYQQQVRLHACMHAWIHIYAHRQT